MMDFELVGLIHLADGKCRTGDFVLRPRPPRQASDKRRLAAAKIADQLNNLTAP